MPSATSSAPSVSAFAPGRRRLRAGLGLVGGTRGDAPDGGPFSKEYVRERLAREIGNLATVGVQYWPCFLPTTGEPVGCCGLRPYEPEERRFAFGFHLRPEHWGVGLAEEAARAIVEHSFSKLAVRSLIAGHIPRTRPPAACSESSASGTRTTPSTPRTASTSPGMSSPRRTTRDSLPNSLYIRRFPGDNWFVEQTGSSKEARWRPRAGSHPFHHAALQRSSGTAVWRSFGADHPRPGRSGASPGRFLPRRAPPDPGSEEVLPKYLRRGREPGRSHADLYPFSVFSPAGPIPRLEGTQQVPPMMRRFLVTLALAVALFSVAQAMPSSFRSKERGRWASSPDFIPSLGLSRAPLDRRQAASARRNSSATLGRMGLLAGSGEATVDAQGRLRAGGVSPFGSSSQRVALERTSRVPGLPTGLGRPAFGACACSAPTWVSSLEPMGCSRRFIDRLLPALVYPDVALLVCGSAMVLAGLLDHWQISRALTVAAPRKQGRR